MQSDKGQAWRLAQAAFASRQWDVARRHLETVLASGPSSPAVLLLLSYTYSYLGRYRAAREAALRAASTALRMSLRLPSPTSPTSAPEGETTGRE